MAFPDLNSFRALIYCPTGKSYTRSFLEGPGSLIEHGDATITYDAAIREMVRIH